MNLLIKNLEELYDVVTFSGDVTYDALKPALRSAQTFLERYVGADLIGELAADELTDNQRKLLACVIVPVGNLALLKFANSNTVLITNLGVKRTMDANSGDAFEWQLERVTAALRQEAFDGIEALLRYLASHIDDFPAYAESEPYKQAASLLIPSATLFNQYYEIGSSRLIFQTLLASMRTAEIGIRKVLGGQLEALLGTALTEQQQGYLDAARRALVYATISRALRERLVNITDTGVQVVGIAQFGTMHYRQQPGDKQLERSIAYFDGEAAQTLTALVTVLTPAPTTPTAPVNPVRGAKIVSF